MYWFILNGLLLTASFVAFPLLRADEIDNGSGEIDNEDDPRQNKRVSVRQSATCRVTPR